MDLLRIDGDSSLQVLWEDGERVVCRGWRLHPDGNRSSVLVVRPAVEHPAPATLGRLAHEYGLRDELHGSWAARPLALLRHQGQTTLVLEDPGGEQLDQMLGAPIETGRFLRLAIGIVAALGQFHQRGLVHKDLKPAHILLNRTNGQVWLTGFGIASRLPSEWQAPEPPETIAGTLAYMAPEQIGRMNRSIDARSDLYALGVTLYQMLTGTLPFTAADPMEWLHCHIARQPVPPAERLPTVPEPVSAIVMKLLAKTAEERYQTAAGVEHDLRRCLAEWECQGRIDAFLLGQRDTPDRLLIPEQFYGREREKGDTENVGDLMAGKPARLTTSTIGAQVELFDLATVITVSQAVAGEIVLEKLIDTLMRMAMAQAGAERALLILARDAELRITAEAITHGDTVAVHLHDDKVTTAMVPEAVLHYALHTRESVILNDAATDPVFATDSYIRQRRAQSILCLPLINQGKLIGVFYLENNLAPRVFTPAGISVLRLVASQAAIALENARLYRDLATREAKIRRLFDANIIGIFTWEFGGRILEANDAFLRMVGYDRQEFVASGLNWRDLTPPEWRPRIRTPRELDEQLKTTSVIQPFEKAYFRKDGSQMPALLGATPFEQGQDQGVAFVLDITQRKRAEQRLAAQYAVTRILAEAATFEDAAPRILEVLGVGLGWDLGALWRMDPRAGVLSCTTLWRAESVKAEQFEAATRTRTFQPGIGLVGRAWTSRAPVWIPDVTRDPTFRRAEVAARDGLRTAFACPILLGNEVLGVIDFVSREIRQPDQDLLDMMATIGSQIGQFMERKQTENALQLAQADLAHVMRVTTMGELTASIAHEINQPLAALTSNAGACIRWLASQPPNLDEAGACLQRIISNTQRAGDVITRIRALVKKSPPVKVRVDLNEAIQEVLALIEPEARRHEVLLRAELAADLLPVHGDRVQLQQVLLNLTMNGIEAMKEVADRSRELRIRTCPHQAGVEVSVQDNGIGLNPASLEHVFEAFYTTKAQGMGMGLSISRSIIEAHGGQLWPSANDEHGATFQFTLPTEDTYDQDTAEVGTGAGRAT